MKSILREQRISSIIMALVTLAMGFLLLFWPDRSVKILCALLGAVLIVTGVAYVVGWLIRRGKGGFTAWLLIPGVLLAAMGLWLLNNPKLVVALIQYIFAAVVIFHGVLDLQSAVVLAAARQRRWWVDLLIALLTLGLGALVLFNPFETFEALVMLIGFSLIYDGLSDLWLILRLSLAFRKSKEENADVQAEFQETQESAAPNFNFEENTQETSSSSEPNTENF